MEWISVNDSVPKDRERCLIVKINAPVDYIEIATYSEKEIDDSNWVSDGFAVFPTHWMPLPTPPES